MGWVRKDVVDQQRPATREARGPALVVEVSWFGSVATVDEQQCERDVPNGCNCRRIAYDRHHMRLEACVMNRPSKDGERIQTTGMRVDEVGFVPLPSGLVLFRSSVVIEGKEESAGIAGGCTKVDR